MNIPKNPTVTIPEVISEGLDRRVDKYLFNIPFTAVLKSITNRQLKSEPPSYNTWIQNVWDVYQMELITFSLRLQKTTFTERWEPILNVLLQSQYL